MIKEMEIIRKKDRKIIVNFTLNKSTIENFRELKKEYGLSMSEVTNILLKEYIKYKKLAKHNVNIKKVIANTEGILNNSQNNTQN